MQLLKGYILNIDITNELSNMKIHHFYNKYTFPKTYGNLSLKHREILMFIFPKNILLSFKN